MDKIYTNGSIPDKHVYLKMPKAHTDHTNKEHLYTSSNVNEAKGSQLACAFKVANSHDTNFKKAKTKPCLRFG